MIITCEKCSTRFNLDESFIKPGGSKVRCSLCKNIFTAFPQVSDIIPVSDPENQTEINVPEETGQEETVTDETGPDDFETDDFEIEPIDSDEIDSESFDSEFDDEGLEFDEEDFEIEGTELEIEDSGLEMEEIESDAADIEISFDQESENFEIETDELTFEDEDIEFNDSDLESDTNVLEKDFDSLELESLDQEVLSLETDDDQEIELSFEDDFDFQEEPDLPEPLSPLEESIPESLPDDDFSSYDQVLDQDTEPEDDFQEIQIEDEQTIEIEEPLAEDLVAEEKPEQGMENALIGKSDPGDPKLIPGRSRKRKRRSTLGAPVMVLLLVFLLVAGAYIASLTLGYKIPYLSEVRIPFLEQYRKKEAPVVPALKPIPSEASVNGRFVSNDTAGELFVITGRIENPSTIAYSHIQVLGTLITKGKAKAQTLKAFCGNIISEELLKTGNILDINKQLTIREGAHNSNVNVKPGSFVPFMLVFSSLPDNLENFTVEVVADQKNDMNQ